MQICKSNFTVLTKFESINKNMRIFQVLFGSEGCFNICAENGRVFEATEKPA